MCGTWVYLTGWLGAKQKQTTTHVAVTGANKQLQLVEIAKDWIDVHHFKMDVILYCSKRATNEHRCFSPVVRLPVIGLIPLGVSLV